MKTKLFTFLAFATIVFSAQQVKAKVRRVGFPGKAVPGTDYLVLQNAIDSSSVKDSIYIFPGSWGTGLVNKRLVFEGYGSPQGDSALQVGLGTTALEIDLYPGSDSTILEGLDGVFVHPQVSTQAANIKGVSVSGGVVNNIIVRRCHCSLIDFNDQILTGWTIAQCIIDYWGASNNVAAGAGGAYQKFYVNNCIIYQLEFNGAFGYATRGSLSSGTGIFVNNIFLAQPGNSFIFSQTNNDNYYGVQQFIHDFNNASFVMQNNIFADSAINNTGGLTWQNNISTHFDIPLYNPNGSATNNKQNVNNSAIFLGYPIQGKYSNDGAYILASGSPAKAAGIGGVDCGAFGGTTPFKLDCVPALPAIFKLSAPSSSATANPYTITFSVRSNN